MCCIEMHIMCFQCPSVILPLPLIVSIPQESFYQKPVHPAGKPMYMMPLLQIAVGQPNEKSFNPPENCKSSYATNMTK